MVGQILKIALSYSAKDMDMDRKWIWIGYAYGSILSKIIAVRVAKPGPGKNYCCEMMAEPGSGGKKIQNLDQVKLIAVKGWQNLDQVKNDGKTWTR